LFILIHVFCTDCLTGDLVEFVRLHINSTLRLVIFIEREAISRAI